MVMRYQLSFITVLLVLFSTVSCKKSGSDSVTPAKDISGSLHVNWKGADYNYSLNAKDTQQLFSISQGYVQSDSGATIAAKKLAMIITDHSHFALNIYAQKLDQVTDTGIYYADTIGGYEYGQFTFQDIATSTYYNWRPDGTPSYIHVSSYKKGAQTNIKGQYYLVGFYVADRQAITGDFDITR